MHMHARKVLVNRSLGSFLSWAVLKLNCSNECSWQGVIGDGLIGLPEE